MVGTNTKSYSVCIRVPMGLKERIDQDIVESGDYASASQWYLAAVRDYVEKREKIRKDRLGGGGLITVENNSKKIMGIFNPQLNGFKACSYVSGI